MNSHSPKPRRVLMILYYYPPLRTSGTYRSLSFALRLPHFGWEPLVLSVKNAKDHWVKQDMSVPEDVAVVRGLEWNLGGVADFIHGALNKVVRLFGLELNTNYARELLCVPDPQMAWCSTWPALRKARKVDCIYASCSPFSSALSGCRVKILSGRPLVLDFRDAWSLNPHVRHLAPHRVLVKLFERVVVAICDKLIVNTEGAAKLYRQHYPKHAGKIQCIPNGYDQLTRATKTERGRYVILHAGSFYGSRTARVLLEVLAEINDPVIEFVHIGSQFPEYEEFKDRVSITLAGSISREEVMKRLGGASLLYLKQGIEPGVTDYVAVGAKTYEYLATGLPILADCPEGDNAQLVREYARYPYVVTSGKPADLKAAIVKAKADWPSVEPEITKQFIENFDRERLTERLAAVFEEVCAA